MAAEHPDTISDKEKTATLSLIMRFRERIEIRTKCQIYCSCRSKREPKKIRKVVKEDPPMHAHTDNSVCHNAVRFPGPATKQRKDIQIGGEYGI